MAEAQPNSLVDTPPMGWNSWDHFGRNVTDANVRAAADAIVSSGMRDAGYIYVNIDDAWEGDRDAQGNIQSNSKFRDMKALADYAHSKGLKRPDEAPLSETHSCRDSSRRDGSRYRPRTNFS